MVKNIFVVGLDDFHLRQLQSLRRSADYRFHQLASYREIKCGEHFPVREFLHRARETLSTFKGGVHAVVGFWDFPVSTILPIIQQEFNLTGAGLIPVLKCEHKYWSRLEQAKVVPELIPPFEKINPFDEGSIRQCALPFPFWLKPVKSVLSHLGFLVSDSTEFNDRLEIIRRHIGRYAEPFNFILEHAELPDEIRQVDGYHCIAEGLISSSHQCTLEGYVFHGEVEVYGIVDSVNEGVHQSSFARYQYPSILDKQVQQRMVDATRKVLLHVGYDNSPFNIEFYWDETSDAIWLLEINTRISKSHCPLFKMVDGEYHHQVMLDVALGHKPNFQHRRGRFNTAAKFMIRRYSDGKVIGVPGEREIELVKRKFPGSEVLIHIRPGMHLSQLRDQDSYSYEIADLFMGADSHHELMANYEKALQMLPFSINPTGEAI